MEGVRERLFRNAGRAFDSIFDSPEVTEGNLFVFGDVTLAVDVERAGSVELALVAPAVEIRNIEVYADRRREVRKYRVSCYI